MEKFNIITFSTRLIHRLQCYLNRNSSRFFWEIKKLILTFSWAWEKPRIDKNLKKQVQIFNLSDFKSYHKATITQAMWYWHEDRQIDQQDKRESKNRSIYAVDWFSTKEPRKFIGGKDGLSHKLCQNKQLYI